MKKILMIAAMMVATVAAKAQFEPGTFTLQPKVGVTLATISSDNTKFKFGMAAGIEGQYQLNNWFGLSAAVMYSQQGFKAKDIDLKGNIEYINVPVMAKFYVTKGLSLNVGVQPGFMTKAKAKLSGKDQNFKDECNKVDFSIPLSIAYEFENGLTFEARYTTGLTNVGKDVFDSSYSSWDKAYQNKNEVLMLTVGYKFEL
ncbi:MAG: PorT family protein [Prevotella sp.]|nr:PorT family protein [Prevotella sp.]MBP3850549.1 PorT family protein [Prevotella sp.]